MVFSVKTIGSKLYPSKKYVFTNDFYGNVTEMFILNENQDTIGKETYKIMQYDDEKQWLEKWGFVNDTHKNLLPKGFRTLKVICIDLDILFFFCIGLLTCGTLSAQISGMVRDQSGQPLPFAAVYWANSTNGTICNEKENIS